MKSLLIDKVKFKIDPIADQRIRLLAADKQTVLSMPALGQRILDGHLPGIVDVVSTDSELLINYIGKLSALLKKIRSIKLSKVPKSLHYELPVCFSKGLDWDIVETQTTLKKNKVISMFLKTSFTLEMYGFLPGFMYLTGLPETLQCLRKAKPRQKVSSGTIALGGPYAGMYNLDSPGGWQSIGHCPLQVFPLEQAIDPMFKIRDTISFHKITLKEWKLLESENLAIQDYKRR